MATSWGQRRALGRRYSQDPALAMELERLEKEYALIPSREARLLERERLSQQQSQYDQNRQDAKLSGITGTVANVGTTAAMMRAMTKAPGEPFFVNPFAAKAPMASITTPQVGQSANAVMGMNAPSYLAENASLAPGAYSINPATVDATSAGISAGADVGMGAGAAETAGASWVPGAGQALALYMASRMTGDVLGDQPWAPKEVSGLLKHPVTGMVGEPAKLLGKATGVKEIGNIGSEVERIEDQVVDFITDPFGSLGDVFGW